MHLNEAMVRCQQGFRGNIVLTEQDIDYHTECVATLKKDLGNEIVEARTKRKRLSGKEEQYIPEPIAKDMKKKYELKVIRCLRTEIGQCWKSRSRFPMNQYNEMYFILAFGSGLPDFYFSLSPMKKVTISSYRNRKNILQSNTLFKSILQ